MSGRPDLPDDLDPHRRRFLAGGTTDPRILETLHLLIAEGRSAVLATVIATSRSVPRRAGARMLVVDDGRRIGTVGGGEMEARVAEEADACLTDGRSRLLDYRLVDPGAGDPGVCGGDVTIHLELHMPSSKVLVIGCGHVGRAVVDLASWLGFHVVATDDRNEVADGLADGLPGDSIVEVRPGRLAEVLADVRLGTNDHAVVVTRNAQVDVVNLPHLLATDVGSIGVMGSLRRWETTRQALLDNGISETDLDRVTSPVGVEIGAETPEEIAVSILAQVVGHRRMA